MAIASTRKKSFKFAETELQARSIKSGATRVKLIRPTPYDFADLRLAKTAASDLALCLLRYAGVRSHSTQSSTYQALRTFAKFIVTDPPRRHSDRLLDFYHYLCRKKQRDGRAITDGYRVQIYRQVQLALQTIPERPLIKSLQTRLPDCPSPYRQHKAPIQTRLSPEELERIRTAARDEIITARSNPPQMITARTLLPYSLIIAIRTWANASSLFGLELDCLREHALDDRRTVVEWNKARSSHRQYRSFLSDADFEPPRLIREVIELTKSIRLDAPKTERQYIFIAEVEKYGRLWGRAKQIRYDHIDGALADFRAQHDLPYFTLRKIRLSMIRGALLAAKNIRLVQRLANHRRRATTLRYTSDREIVEMADEFIGDIQTQFHEFLVSDISDPKRIESELSVSPEAAAAIASGKNATLSGFHCKNPFEGIAPGSTPGELCPSFLSCFRCSNRIIGNDVESAARLIQFRDAIVSDEPMMAAERYQYLYAWAIEMIDTYILPLYSDSLLAEATVLARSLPALPSFVE